jgi:hypothetical protein
MSDPARAMHYMAMLDEPEVIDIVSGALGGKLAVHRQFRERHGLEHADAAHQHKCVTPDANAQHSYIPSANLPLNLPSFTGNSAPESDLQMNIAFSSLSYPCEHHAQAPSNGKNKFSVLSGVHAIEEPKSSKHRIMQFRDAPPSQVLSMELQEVIVHGSDSAAGAKLAAAKQQHAMTRCGQSVESAAPALLSQSSSGVRGVRPNKIIRALGPERKCNFSATKSSRNEAVGVVDPAMMGCQTSTEQCKTADAELNRCMIARGSEGAMQSSVPLPPPRSRSSSRVRAARGNSMVAPEKDKLGDHLSNSSSDPVPSPTHFPFSQSLYQLSDFPPRDRHQVAMEQAALSVTRRGEDAHAPSPANDPQELSFLNCGTVVRSRQRDTDRPSDYVGQRPAESPRWQSHSDLRSEAAGSCVSEQLASFSSTTKTQSMQVSIARSTSMSNGASIQVTTLPSILNDSVHEVKAPAAPEEQTRKKQSSRRQTKHEASKSRIEKVRIIKDRGVSQFEEC